MDFALARPPYRLGLETGWLVIFDRRADQPPIAERTASSTTVSPQGRCIQVERA